MRILCLIGCLALASACSSFSVRCDKHLHPINPPQSPVDTASRKLPEWASGGTVSGKP
jgi:hypothetical protein